MRVFLVKIVSTFFYTGYLPFMPGTFGSIAALAIFILIKGNIFLTAVFMLLFLLLGLAVTTGAERIFNKKDAGCIVIDEASGMLLCLIGMPYDLRLVLAAFVLFRIFDILKPYPANKLQQLRGSLGIMSDDLIAAAYVNIILQIALRFTVLRGS